MERNIYKNYTLIGICVVVIYYKHPSVCIYETVYKSADIQVC